MDRYGVVIITDYTSEYGPSTKVEMRPAPTGDWVRYEDVPETDAVRELAKPAESPAARAWTAAANMLLPHMLSGETVLDALRRLLARPAEPEISDRPAMPETIEGGAIGYWHRRAQVLGQQLRSIEDQLGSLMDLSSLREDSIAWRAACAALAPHAQPGENTAGTLARILLWHGPHRSELVGAVAAHARPGENVTKTFKRLMDEHALFTATLEKILHG
jgi:hypothetical protein